MKVRIYEENITRAREIGGIFAGPIRAGRRPGFGPGPARLTTNREGTSINGYKTTTTAPKLVQRAWGHARVSIDVQTASGISLDKQERKIRRLEEDVRETKAVLAWRIARCRSLARDCATRCPRTSPRCGFGEAHLRAAPKLA